MQGRRPFQIFFVGFGARNGTDISIVLGDGEDMYLEPSRTIIGLTFLYLSCAFALPITPELLTDTPQSVSTYSTDIFGTTSIWAITWSCWSTIFACTWIAVHPNIPGPEDSQWSLLRKRMAIMGCALIAPEYVLGWAARQYWAARYLAKQHQEHGWTMSHGFFIGMGGFTLHDQRGTAVKILEPKELEKLYNEGKVAWPSITEEEIQDRSKGDYLSKGVVLLQMSWFIIQCIVRAAYGLAITELEVVTLTFAVLSGITYHLWWHKPLDVRRSVPVYLLPQDPQSPIRKELQILQQSLIIPNPNSRELNSTSTSQPNSTRIQRLPEFLPKQRQEHGIFFGLAHVFIYHSLLEFLQAVGEIEGSTALHSSSPLGVHTFYSPWDDMNQSHFFVISFTICVAVVFGGIHCIAWSFQFPSPQERLAWRISAAFTSGEPILYGLLIIIDNHQVALLTICAKTLFVSVTIMYFVARIVLLVLPCIALRALPPSALIDIQWLSLFPHIG